MDSHSVVRADGRPDGKRPGGRDTSPEGDGSEGTTDRERLTVGIAEYDVSATGEVLATSGLGSCVAIALYDPGTEVSGLVHAMLPTAEEAVGGIEAKYADSGIEALLGEMERAGADRGRIEARIAGGSEMLSFGGEEPSIGVRNVEATKEALSGLGLSLVAEDVGGGAGRSVTFDPAAGELTITVARGETRTL